MVAAQALPRMPVSPSVADALVASAALATQRSAGSAGHASWEPSASAAMALESAVGQPDAAVTPVGAGLSLCVPTGFRAARLFVCTDTNGSGECSIEEADVAAALLPAVAAGHSTVPAAKPLHTAAAVAAAIAGAAASSEAQSEDSGRPALVSKAVAQATQVFAAALTELAWSEAQLAAGTGGVGCDSAVSGAVGGAYAAGTVGAAALRQLTSAGKGREGTAAGVRDPIHVLAGPQIRCGPTTLWLEV